MIRAVGRTSVRRARLRARRGVALVSAIVALAIPAGRAVGASSSQEAADHGGRAAVPRSVVVRPGDTLWGIAAALVGPAGDPRPLVDAIARTNGVDPGEIRPGQVLVIPAP